MKIYIVMSGSSDVPYRGSWNGCLQYCLNNTDPLRIAVMRAGERSGVIVAETNAGGIKAARCQTSVDVGFFKRG